VGTTATTTILGTATSTFGAGIQGTYLNITGTSATSTFARGINLSGGCFAINGTCVSGSGGSGSGTVNSGTQYQTAFYASNGTAVSGTSTLTIRDEKVGINNTDPTYPLEIGNNRLTVDSNGSIETIGNVTTNGGNVYLNYFGQTPLIGNAGGGSSSGLITYGGTDATSRLLLRSTTGSGTSDYIAMQVGNNGATEALRILNGGRIAAGTTTPFANKLLTLATSTGSNLSITDGSLTSSQWDFRNKNGILYIATSSPTTGATSTIPAIQANSTGYPSLSVGTTTSTGILNLGANPTAGAATSTIFMEKIQIQGKNSAGTLSCAYIAGTSWVIQAGACNN
jgi:hypothetical protein